MQQRNPQIDQIIIKANHCAQPILIHFRELVHAVCHEVEEKIKWECHFIHKSTNHPEV